MTLTDDELRKKIEAIHIGFRVSSPLFEAGTIIARAVKVTEKPTNKARVSYLPPSRVIANGRLNRRGEVMFYGSIGAGATRMLACLLECRCAEGERFAVSIWTTTKPILMHHLGYSIEVMEQAKARRDLPHWAVVDGETERDALIRAWQARVFTRTVVKGEEHLYRLSIA